MDCVYACGLFCCTTCVALSPAGEPLRQVDAFDFGAWRWVSLPALSTPRANPALCAMAEGIFVAGGESSGLAEMLTIPPSEGAKPEPEEALPTSQQWRRRCAWSAASHHSSEKFRQVGAQGACVLQGGDGVLLVGLHGYAGVYEPRSRTWREDLPPMRYQRERAGVCTTMAGAAVVRDRGLGRTCTCTPRHCITL